MELRVNYCLLKLTLQKPYNYSDDHRVYNPSSYRCCVFGRRTLFENRTFYLKPTFPLNSLPKSCIIRNRLFWKRQFLLSFHYKLGIFYRETCTSLWNVNSICEFGGELCEKRNVSFITKTVWHSKQRNWCLARVKIPKLVKLWFNKKETRFFPLNSPVHNSLPNACGFYWKCQILLLYK